LDGAVAIFDSVGGVEPQSETVWRQADKYNVPRISYVNKMDRVGADFKNVLSMMKSKLGMDVVAIELPIGKEDTFSGVIDLVSMKAYVYKEEDFGATVVEKEIPSEYINDAHLYREMLIEKICDFDEELMSVLLEEKQPEISLVKKAIRAGVLSNKITPVLCGSSFKNKGVQQLLDAVLDYLPSPLDRLTVSGYNPQTHQEELRKANDDDPFCALVFKIVADPHLGRLAFARAYSGSIDLKSTILNPRTNTKERITRIFRMHSNKRKPEQIMHTGEILGIAGLKDTVTGDTICDPNRPISLEAMIFPQPVIFRSIEPKSTSDEEKLHVSLARLADEDPTCTIRVDQETGQTIISGMGELHLEILIDRLVREFNVEAHVGKPQVSYRETITGSTSENFEFSQLIGGKNQFAKVEISVESISPSKGSEFESRVSEQDFPAEFIAAAKQGILETSGCGVLSGYPLLGIKTILKSIAFREEESTEMSFKIAGSMAFKNACIKCLPALLEPIMKIEVVVPVDFMGVVINDLNSRRGKINGISSRKDIQVIDGESPLAEMFGYATMLRSITQGRASYTMQFDHYEPTNKNIQDEILRRIGRIW